MTGKIELILMDMSEVQLPQIKPGYDEEARQMPGLVAVYRKWCFQYIEASGSVCVHDR